MTKKNIRALVICAIAVLASIASEVYLRAQMGVGEWVRTDKDAPPGMTMTVEACCGSGRRLTYHVPLRGGEMLMTVDSAFDGADAAVLFGGKPSGETMAIKRVDPLHLTAVVKMNGQQFGTYKATLSADGKTLTVEGDYTASVGGQPAGKQTEVWVRK